MSNKTSIVLILLLVVLPSRLVLVKRKIQFKMEMDQIDLKIYIIDLFYSIAKI